MIQSQVSSRSEPLRGNDLRAALRTICAVPMPEYEFAEPAAAEPEVVTKRRLSDAHKKAVQVVQERIRAEKLANRPPGFMHPREVADARGHSLGWFAHQTRKHHITRNSFDGTFAWYRIETLKEFGLL